jgi:hypothetical protein
MLKFLRSQKSDISFEISSYDFNKVQKTREP